MSESAAPRPHVSQNRVQGSLEEATVDQLIDACFKHLVTGTLAITGEGGAGVIELRAGAVESASYGD